MNRVIPLAETPLVRITRFEHPEGEPHLDPREETSTSVALSFVLRGSFSIRSGARRFDVTPRTVFATRPGLAYRTYHAEDRPTDICLSIEYAPEFFSDGSSGVAPAEPVFALTNRTAYLKWRLRGGGVRRDRRGSSDWRRRRGGRDKTLRRAQPRLVRGAHRARARPSRLVVSGTPFLGALVPGNRHEPVSLRGTLPL